MAINVKKYTKDQMAKMVEEAAERLKSQKKENEELAEQLKSQTAKTIALRNDLMAKMHSNVALTEAALGRANGECAFKQEIINVMRDRRYNAEQRANYAESHPWRNLWAWVKRKLGGERNEHVS